MYVWSLEALLIVFGIFIYHLPSLFSKLAIINVHDEIAATKWQRELHVENTLSNTQEFPVVQQDLMHQLDVIENRLSEDLQQLVDKFASLILNGKSTIV